MQETSRKARQLTCGAGDRRFFIFFILKNIWLGEEKEVFTNKHTEGWKRRVWEEDLVRRLKIDEEECLLYVGVFLSVCVMGGVGEKLS